MDPVFRCKTVQPSPISICLATFALGKYRKFRVYFRGIFHAVVGSYTVHDSHHDNDDVSQMNECPFSELSIFLEVGSYLWL